jgi:hypothetical protein
MFERPNTAAGCARSTSPRSEFAETSKRRPPRRDDDRKYEGHHAVTIPCVLSPSAAPPLTTARIRSLSAADYRQIGVNTKRKSPSGNRNDAPRGHPSSRKATPSPGGIEFRSALGLILERLESPGRRCRKVSGGLIRDLRSTPHAGTVLMRTILPGRRLADETRLPDVAGERLLAVDVLPGRQREIRCERMGAADEFPSRHLTRTRVLRRLAPCRVGVRPGSDRGLTPVLEIRTRNAGRAARCEVHASSHTYESS